jgi:hypothetical protein
MEQRLERMRDVAASRLSVPRGGVPALLAFRALYPVAAVDPLRPDDFDTLLLDTNSRHAVLPLINYVADTANAVFSHRRDSMQDRLRFFRAAVETLLYATRVLADVMVLREHRRTVVGLAGIALQSVVKIVPSDPALAQDAGAWLYHLCLLLLDDLRAQNADHLRERVRGFVGRFLPRLTEIIEAERELEEEAAQRFDAVRPEEEEEDHAKEEAIDLTDD